MADFPPVPKSNPHVMFVLCFFVTWLVTALVIGLANWIAPNQYVLGTVNIPYPAALLLSSGVIAWITTLFIPAFTQIEMNRKKILSPIEWMIGYLVINTILLWLVARLAEIFGLGISSWIMVVVLALVLDFFQGMAMMGVGEVTKKNK